MNNEPKESSHVTMSDGSTADNYNAKTGLLEGKGKVIVGKHTYVGTWNQEGKLTDQNVTITNVKGGKFVGNVIDSVRQG